MLVTWVYVCDLISSSYKPIGDRFNQDALAHANTSDCTHLPQLRSKYVPFWQFKSLKIKLRIYSGCTMRKYLFNVICS